MAALFICECFTEVAEGGHVIVLRHLEAILSPKESCTLMSGVSMSTQVSTTRCSVQYLN